MKSLVLAIIVSVFALLLLVSAIGFVARLMMMNQFAPLLGVIGILLGIAAVLRWHSQRLRRRGRNHP